MACCLLQMFVVDGSDGSLIWYNQSPSPPYAAASILSVSLAKPDREAFIHEISSTNMPFTGGKQV